MMRNSSFHVTKSSWRRHACGSSFQDAETNRPGRATRDETGETSASSLRSEGLARQLNGNFPRARRFWAPLSRVRSSSSAGMRRAVTEWGFRNGLRTCSQINDQQAIHPPARPPFSVLSASEAIMAVYALSHQYGASDSSTRLVYLQHGAFANKLWHLDYQYVHLVVVLTWAVALVSSTVCDLNRMHLVNFYNNQTFNRFQVNSPVDPAACVRC